MSGRGKCYKEKIRQGKEIETEKDLRRALKNFFSIKV
jgi:hypothetical protein